LNLFTFCSILDGAEGGFSMPNTTTNAPSSDVVGFSSNDYHILPVTEKQLQFARAISERTGQPLSESVQQDRQALSAWISENKEAPSDGGFGNYASSKQVAFAERIARLKHRTVPNACIRDRSLMSKWIDCNK
jgi:hypothetical protein